MDILSYNPFLVPNENRFYIDAHQKPEREGDLGLISDFSEFVLQKGYPCVGAQAAVNGNTYATGVFDNMEDKDTPKYLAYGLIEYLNAMANAPSDFLTYIAIFPDSKFENELSFEMGLWKLLDRLQAEDRKHFEWNPAYSKNPADSSFTFSFGKQGFFIVGLHPNSSRKARRFKYPALAFNLQRQFDALREKRRFGVMSKAIRKREIRFQGSVNPMLADYGEGLQAPQYSGRQVPRDWKCPFMGKQ